VRRSRKPVAGRRWRSGHALAVFVFFVGFGLLALRRSVVEACSQGLEQAIGVRRVYVALLERRAAG
jgi:hypothetical protein